MKNCSIIIYLSLIFSLFCRCKEPLDEIVSEEGQVDPGIEIVDSVYMTRIDSTGLLFELTSPRMIVSFTDNSTNEEYPAGLDIVFHNKSNNSKSLISADYAFVDENGLTTIKGDVLIQSEKGDRLETSHLLWDQQFRTLQSEKMIRLIQATGDTTFGFGLNANEDFSRFQIKNGYAGKVKFDDLKSQLGL
tara:strand:+ start:196 stop:765 length:570 start_codon:yes stop_codon:yes gene_type:complete